MSVFRVAVDYGTSTTVAFLGWPDGRVRPLLFGDSPLLPSAVYLEDDGRPLTGRDAVRSARFDPSRYEANPKRRIDDGEVFLGAEAVPVEDLIAATLRRVWQEAGRSAGEPPAELVLTHPVAWGETRRGVLLRAADRAGLPPAVLVPEPVAAATYFAAVLGRQVAPGQCVVVYDLGAGTFDVSLVRGGAAGFATLATGGLADLGGLDLDAVIVDLLRAGRRPEHGPAWERLDAPGGLTGRRAFRELWDGAREAKEALSRRASAPASVPGVAEPQHVTRIEFEAAATLMLARTVAVTREAIRAAGVGREEVAGVFLVGGSTRVPLVASMLHQATGIAPTVIEQPELVVAEGALHVPGPRTVPVHAGPTPAGQASPRPISPGPVSAGPILPGPVSAGPVSPGPILPGPVSPAGRFGDSPPSPGDPPMPRPARRRGILATLTAAVLVLILLTGFAVWRWSGKPDQHEGSGPLSVGDRASTSVSGQPVGVASNVSPGSTASASTKASVSVSPGKGKPAASSTPTPRFTGPITVSSALVKTRISYTGACPPPNNTPILLYADITVNGPTEVTWHWKEDPRWDPEAPTPTKMVFTAAGTQRTSGFYGGWSNTPGTTTSYWVQFVITQPTQITSEQITWSTTCTT